MKIIIITDDPEPRRILEGIRAEFHSRNILILNTLEGLSTIFSRLSIGENIFHQPATQPPVQPPPINLSETVESLRYKEPFFVGREFRDPSICEKNNFRRWGQESKRIRSLHKQRQLKIPR